MIITVFCTIKMSPPEVKPDPAADSESPKDAEVNNLESTVTEEPVYVTNTVSCSAF